jgi:penicillin-binding protein 1B
MPGSARSSGRGRGGRSGSEGEPRGRRAAGHTRRPPPTAPPRWRRRLLLAGLACGLVVGIAGALFVTRIDARVRTYLDGPAIGTTRIFAAPKTLTAGTPVAPERLIAVLARLGYAERRGDGELVAGTFRRSAAGIDLWQYDVPVPWPRSARRARIAIGDGRVTSLVALDGGETPRALEFRPEPLAVGGNGGSALEATAEAVPDHCRDAVLAAEDRHFFRHPGVDPIAIVRATIANVTPGGPTQGGSTLTQQLVKNTFLSPRRTLTRKVQEALLALLLETRASKREILGRYLASVYLGTDGGVPVHGLAQGALVHFGKPLRDLDVAECATLAGMIRAPNRLAPRRHPEAARARRDQIIALMVESDYLSAEQAAHATAEPIAPAPAGVRPVGALYVADQVQRELLRVLPPDVARSPGLVVYTGVDADTQHDAERVVRDGLTALAKRGGGAERLQAALVALDPVSGRVRALMGGRDYRSSQLDRAAHARRQPGSTFKPFVYLTALDPARSGSARRTLASLLDDEPITLRAGGQLWRPANYDGTYHGSVTLPDALARSLNAATVRLALDVGIAPIARTAQDLGLSGPLPIVPSLALGVGETSLLELTAAYGVVAAGGVKRAPVLVVAVASADGELLYVAPAESERVIEPGVAYLVTNLLERVIDEGTGAGARRAGLRGALAGKTGTTDDTRDAWFIGFSPDLVAGVWVGRDEGGKTGLTGATGALPIWTEFMRRTSRRYLERPFYVPPDVVWRDVDPQSGQLATAYCPLRRRLPFLQGTAPATGCTLHGAPSLAQRFVPGGRPEDSRPSSGGLGGWFRRLFR